MERIPSMELGRQLRDLLSWAQSAEGCLGLLLVSELALLLANIPAGKKIRLVAGNNADRFDPADLFKALVRRGAVRETLEQERSGRKARQQRLTRLREIVQRDLAHLSQTDQEQAALVRLEAHLACGGLDIRAYLHERLTSEFLAAHVSSQPSTGILGGGNLLAPELLGESTLWLRARSPEFVAELRGHFGSLWEESVAFREPLLEELRGSWALQTTTPYLLYLSVLYRLVADRLHHEDEQPDPADWLTGTFPTLADFQLVAVQQALTILNQYRGVFVADVVGLGKTYIGTALLKRLKQRGQRATIFCPPALVPMWEEMSERFDLGAAVFSTGRLAVNGRAELQEARFRTDDRQVVLIDESHRFRNTGAESYKVLKEYTIGRSVVLLTATPYSLQASDIQHQIQLFADDELDLGLNPPRLGEFFRSIDSGKASLVDVLRPLLIRRTRKHIQKHYPDAQINGKKLVFPTREKPQVVRYDVESVFGTAEQVSPYDYIKTLLGRPANEKPNPGIESLGFEIPVMTYARYGLYHYVRPAFRSVAPYKNLKQTGIAVKGFIRILLFKRLESSVEAIRQTVDKMILVHENFLTALDQGLVPAGDAAQRLLYEQDLSDEEAIGEALAATGTRYDPVHFELDRLRGDLENDHDVLTQLKLLLEPITPLEDGKLTELRRLLTERLAGQKVIVFTQFEATARYLAESLRDLPQLAWLSGQHRGAGKSFLRTIARFAPNANPRFADSKAEPVRILIATDVLSEGLNLQDCSVIVNYDLTYNPVRLIQRVGRVDRVGSEAESIWSYNFLPERNVEKVLGLEEVLKRRIGEIHTFIGEDNAILTPDERLNDAEMYAAYQDSPDSEADLGSAAVVDFTEIEERMRQLQRNDPELFARVRDLPPGVRSARQVHSGKPGTFVYFATDAGFEKLELLDSIGNVQTERLEEILEALECGPDEPELPIPHRHNTRVSNAFTRFQEVAAGRQTDQQIGPRLGPGQLLALRHLELALKEELNEDRRQFLESLRAALRSHLPEAAVRSLNQYRRLGLDRDSYLSRLQLLYRDMDLGRFVQKAGEAPTQPVARIVCSEGLIG